MADNNIDNSYNGDYDDNNSATHGDNSGGVYSDNNVGNTLDSYGGNNGVNVVSNANISGGNSAIISASDLQQSNYNNNNNNYNNNYGTEEYKDEPEYDEDDDDDAYYENPTEVIREFGNNPLMERAQKALQKQLEETQYKLSTELYEKNEELKRASAERESLGVQLYSLQQQLARIQISLETAHNSYNSIVDTRLSEEEILAEVLKNNKEQLALQEEYKKQHKKYSAELEALNETIRQIEKYNEEVKSEIAITRRATYKAEQGMQELEKQKEAQDVYVDMLGKQVRDSTEENDLYIKQYETQRKDTDDANAVLNDTIRELDLISSEKKQLMIQWKAALSGLSRRDEALAQATLTLAAAESAVHDYDVEMEASKREVQREQAKHESLVNLRDRLENELQWVEENLTKIRIERDQLQERYTLLTKSLAQTDHESKKLEQISKQISNETDTYIKNLQIVTAERQKMEEDLQVIFSQHHNVNKAVENYSKDQLRILKKIHEKENEIIEIENEVARRNVEKLNISTANDTLHEQLGNINKELKDKELLIGKYQLEIRQRNDEVEKKMYRVDRLNKKYEKMVESVGGEENLGPLENTIKNLNKDIERLVTECKELERDWLRKQTELVNFTAECDNLSEKNNEQQARVTIMTQQQLRLTRDLRELKSNLKVAQKSNADLQNDVSKLNTLISSNHDQETELQGANFIIEKDCLEQLKSSERECLVLQSTINEIKQSKATLLDQIMELERQGLLWEKKIQLDKETRQALDPSVGVAETKTMETEIHRMELRYNALLREQERLSIEMESAITKRATIATRYNKPKPPPKGNAKSATQKPTELTQAAARKRIGLLKKEARILAEETSQYSAIYDEKKNQLTQMTSDLEQITADYGESEEQCHQLQTHINDLLYQKQLFQERISYRQKYANRMRELAASGTDPSQSLQVERRVLSASQSLDNVKEIINDMQSIFPHLKEVLERVGAMADPNLEVLSNQ